MGTFRPTTEQVVVRGEGPVRKTVLLTPAFESFNPSLLGLGDIATPSSHTDAIAAVFDLEGFTNFCRQIEPHLSVPTFLSGFLDWIFKALRDEVVSGQHADGPTLFCPLPFFVKFMGDGLLVLWDASGHNLNNVARRNILVSALTICARFKTEFLPTVQRSVVDAPQVLRCGLARGTVYSIGNGEDFVGSCINMAARLQRIPGITYCFNRRGFDLEEDTATQVFGASLVLAQYAVRGIGERELVAVLRREFDALSREQKKLFRKV